MYDGATIENVVVKNTSADDTWSSTYGIQCYDGSYTIKDVKISGCNAGILVNSATVTLEGTIDVSNNYFGGIEVSHSSNEGTTNAVLNINNAEIINTTETQSKPTIWTDSEDSVVNGAESMYVLNNSEKEQTYYYLYEENATTNTGE